MPSTTWLALGLAWLLAAAGPLAHAKPTIYRCGQTYQQVPCAPGQGDAVQAADPRTAAQRQDANAAARAERQQASNLAAERREREKAVVPQTGPMGIAAPSPQEAASAPPAPKKKKSTKKDAEPRYWSRDTGKAP